MNNRNCSYFALVFILTLVSSCTSLSKSSTQGIEEAKYISIGGIEQWITIRGNDKSNPVLFYVHGGPGAAQSAYINTYSQFEKDFVLVQWDQRGSGKTFQLLGKDTPGLNPQTLIRDGVEIADYLHSRFPNSPLFLLGHSYGSFIATNIAQDRPEIFSAYVGTGQLTQLEAGFTYQKDYLLKAAANRGDQETVTWLESIEKFSLNGRWFGVLSRYMGDADIQWQKDIPNLLSSSTNVDGKWIEALRNGQNFSGSRLVGTFPAINLFETAPNSSIPFCLIQGSEDLQTPTPTVETYFEMIKAPNKSMAVIEGAGHFAISTHTAAFISALKECPGIF